MFAIGLAIGGGAIELHRSDQERLAASARARGTVTALLNGRPIVSFALPSGDRLSFTAAGSSSYAIGRRVDVLYRVDLPTEATIDRPAVRLLRYGVLAAASAAMMALGGYVAWYARRSDARRAAS